jgi:hypothetical protein
VELAIEELLKSEQKLKNELSELQKKMGKMFGGICPQCQHHLTFNTVISEMGGGVVRRRSSIPQLSKAHISNPHVSPHKPTRNVTPPTPPSPRSVSQIAGWSGAKWEMGKGLRGEIEPGSSIGIGSGVGSGSGGSSGSGSGSGGGIGIGSGSGSGSGGGIGSGSGGGIGGGSGSGGGIGSESGSGSGGGSGSGSGNAKGTGHVNRIGRIPFSELSPRRKYNRYSLNTLRKDLFLIEEGDSDASPKGVNVIATENAAES